MEPTASSRLRVPGEPDQPASGGAPRSCLLTRVLTGTCTRRRQDQGLVPARGGLAALHPSFPHQRSGPGTRRRPGEPPPHSEVGRGPGARSTADRGQNRGASAAAARFPAMLRWPHAARPGPNVVTPRRGSGGSPRPDPNGGRRRRGTSGHTYPTGARSALSRGPGAAIKQNAGENVRRPRQRPWASARTGSKGRGRGQERGPSRGQPQRIQTLPVVRPQPEGTLGGEESTGMGATLRGTNQYRAQYTYPKQTLREGQGRLP